MYVCMMRGLPMPSEPQYTTEATNVKRETQRVDALGPNSRQHKTLKQFVNALMNEQ